MSLVKRWRVMVVAMAALVALFSAEAMAKPRFAALAVDARTGAVLFSSDADGLRYPASLTKMMTLYILFQELKSGEVKLSTPLRVSARATRVQPSKLGLRAGESITVETAIKALVVKSANDAAVTVAENLGGSESAFAARMTRTARALGMSRTTFRNASGLPNPGQMTTARDMATLSLRLMRDFPQYYPYFRATSFFYKGRLVRGHNALLQRFAGTDGIKTGYIGAAGYNLTTSTRRGDRRVVGVVLGARSVGARNAYMMRMLDGVLPKCRGGNTIAALPGSSRGIINPIAPRKETAAAALPPQTAEVIGGIAAGKPRRIVGTTSASVIAPSDQPQVLEARMAADDGSGADALAEPVPQVKTAAAKPEKLPFAVKKPGSDAGGEMVVAAIDPGWNIQIGAFPSRENAERKLSDLSRVTSLRGKRAYTIAVQKGSETFYRARYAGFNRQTAATACRDIKRRGQSCMVLAP